MQFPRLAPLPPQGLPDWLQPDAAPAQIVPNSPVQAPQINPVKRPGMFGNANWGSAISAALNGYLAAGGNPAGQMGLQQLHQRKMMEQRQKMMQEQYQQQRQDGREDKQWEWENKPQAPHRWESNDGSLMELDPATGQPRVAYKDPTPKPNWIQVKDPATGEVRIINAGTMGGSAPPPTLSDEDWPTEGGSGGNAGGNFPY